MGIIALAGVAAETGVVMLVYLDEAYERRVREGRMTTAQDLREAIMEGAVQRVRPKMMTVAAIMGGLLPIMWTTGTGADVMKRIAAPMIGGMVSSTILTLIVIPTLYFIFERNVGWPRWGASWGTVVGLFIGFTGIWRNSTHRSAIQHDTVGSGRI